MKTKITVLLTSLAFATSVFVISCTKKEVQVSNISQTGSNVEALLSTPPPQFITCMKRIVITNTPLVTYTPQFAIITQVGTPPPNVYFRTYKNNLGVGAYTLYANNWSVTQNNSLATPYFEYIVGATVPSKFAAGTMLSNICP